MKKSIVLLWVLLLISMTSLLAQTEEENKEVYSQLKEWAVVKLTIAYMEDLYSFNPKEKGKNGNEKEYKTYEILYSKISSVKDIIDLEEVGEILINGSWKTTKSKVFDKYKIELIDNIERFNFDNIEPFGYKDNTGKTKYNDALKEISKEFDYKVSNKVDARKKEEDKGKLKEVTESNKRKEEPLKGGQNNSIDSYVNNNSLFIFYGIIGLLILIIIVLIIKNKGLKKNKKIKKDKISNNIGQSENKLSNPTIQTLRQEKNSLINKIKDLERKIVELEKNIQNQNSNNVSIKPSEESVISDNEPSKEIVLEVSRKSVESNIIYLLSPFKEFTFANEDATSQQETNSIYKIELNEGTQSGKFLIIEDADLTRALNSPDVFLKTVCIYENEFNNNARTIKNVEVGEITLEGEDWVVTKKVRIKFI